MVLKLEDLPKAESSKGAENGKPLAIGDGDLPKEISTAGNKYPNQAEEDEATFYEENKENEPSRALSISPQNNLDLGFETNSDEEVGKLNFFCLKR